MMKLYVAEDGSCETGDDTAAQSDTVFFGDREVTLGLF